MGQDKVATVLQLWGVGQSVDAPSEEVRRGRFTQVLRHLGWKHRQNGGFKDAFIKGGLVVKYDRTGENDANTLMEWNIWRRAKPYKKGFLAPCLAYDDGLLVQQYLSNLCRRKEHCPIAQWYAWRFRILDWSVNHAHRASGLPLFFDYDNRGWDGRGHRKRPPLIRFAA